MRLFYGFHFHDGRNTTTGRPNYRTGHLSIAGDLKVFTSKAERDEWVEASPTYQREAVTRKQARELCLGLSMQEFNDFIRHEAMTREEQVQEIRTLKEENRLLKRLAHLRDLERPLKDQPEPPHHSPEEKV